jgi:hypothetical protein
VGRLIEAAAAVLVVSVVILAVGIGLVAGGLLSPVVGVGAGLIVIGAAGSAAMLVLENRPPPPPRGSR